MCISSHITTLSALVRARKPGAGCIGQLSVLAVGVSLPEGRDGTNGFLPFVGEEFRRLREQFPNVVVVNNKHALHDAVLKCLPVRSWDRSLSIQEIVRADLANAEFAFLSACHTATSDLRAPDEGLHHASAMPFAGYRSVVGTLLAIIGDDGLDPTETFYKLMFHDAQEAVDCKDAAKGVWRISAALQKKNFPLDQWINFIHVGA